jgi:GNAT superfamily N-acetyltransferase
MADDEPLRTGWEPGCPPEDNVTQATLWNTADRLEHHTLALGGQFERDDEWVLADGRSKCSYLNMAVALQPVTTPDTLARPEAFFDSPGGWVLVSPWPLPDLSGPGRLLLGHPPFMVRPPGGNAPRPPAELVVEEATTPEQVHDFERVLIDGVPLDQLAGSRPGALFVPHAVAPARLFVGRVEGRPVTAAAGTASHGVVQVEFVATLPDARGRGYGEAATWAATTIDPSLPAVLLASDPGRPVYERMGYLAISRWSLWVCGLG